MPRAGGVWRSPVAHLLWEQGAGGSNPLTPTIFHIEGVLIEGAMKAQVVIAILLVLALAAPALAFNCPVVIKQAEDLIRKAEGTKTNADSKPLIDEAKKLVGEAKTHHESAKTKKDHAEAIRKAKTASAYAEEAITLATP